MPWFKIVEADVHPDALPDGTKMDELKELERCEMPWTHWDAMAEQGENVWYVARLGKWRWYVLIP